MYLRIRDMNIPVRHCIFDEVTDSYQHKQKWLIVHGIHSAFPIPLLHSLIQSGFGRNSMPSLS